MTAVLLLALVLAGAAVGVFVLVVLSIKYEDRHRSLTHSPHGALSHGTRRVLGLSVDHTDCLLHPERACPTCETIDETVTV